jgi:hypothetical protein
VLSAISQNAIKLCFNVLNASLAAFISLLRLLWFAQKRKYGDVQSFHSSCHHSFFSSSRNRNVKAVWLPSRKKYGAKPFQYANTPSLRPILTKASSSPLRQRRTMSRTSKAKEASSRHSSGATNLYGIAPSASGFIVCSRVLAMSSGMLATVHTRPEK